MGGRRYSSCRGTKLKGLKPDGKVETPKEVAKDLRTIATDLQTLEGRYETKVTQLEDHIKTEATKIVDWVETEERLLKELEEETARKKERIQKDYKGFRDAAELKLLELRQDLKETKEKHKEAVAENAKFIAEKSNALNAEDVVSKVAPPTQKRPWNHPWTHFCKRRKITKSYHRKPKRG